jgi:predicted transposase/invertase (TIGR01784 family)
MCITEYTREKELYFHKREVEEAHENGRIEGITENQISIAKNMLLNGISDELIINCTGISPDTLSEIKKTMN